MGKDRGPGGSTNLPPFLCMNVQMMDPRSSRKMANVSGNILDIELAKERLECWRLEGIFCWVGDWKVSGIIYKLLRVENPNYHKMIPLFPISLHPN